MHSRRAHAAGALVPPAASALVLAAALAGAALRAEADDDASTEDGVAEPCAIATADGDSDGAGGDDADDGDDADGGGDGAKEEPPRGAPAYEETTVVTASRTEEPIEDAPVSITVISAEQVATTPATNVGDLLRGVPGLNVVQLSARDVNLTSRAPAQSLATGILALVDGRSIYQDFFGFVMWDLLPTGFEEVKQVEVLRGPGSAMWGANALTGVVNVRTKSPRESLGGAFRMGAGERSLASAGVRWADAGRRASWRIATSWLEQDAWGRNATLPDGTPLPPDALFANEGTRQPKIDVRVDQDGNADRRWSYRASWTGTSGIMHSGIGPFTIDPDSRMGSGEVSFEGRHLEARLYLNAFDGDAVNLLNTLPFAFTTKTWVADVTGRRPVGKRQLLVFGGAARLNRFDLSLAPGEDSRREVGAFLEDQIAFGERALLSAGARLDWFDTVGLALSPRTSLVWKPREGHAFRFAWNRAYRAPSLINNFLDTVVPNQYVLDPASAPFIFLTFAQGRRDLEEEVVDAFEAAWTRTFRSGATFAAAVHRNVTRDVIDFHPEQHYSPADPPIGWSLPPEDVPVGTLVKLYRYRNVGRVVDQGLELSLSARLARAASYTASCSYQARSQVSGVDPLEPLNVNVAPRHQAGFTLLFGGDRLRGQAFLGWTDRAYWTDVLDDRFHGWTDAFLQANASLVLSFGDVLERRTSGSPSPVRRFELTLSGTNLTNDKIQQHVFADIIRRQLASTLRVRF